MTARGRLGWGVALGLAGALLTVPGLRSGSRDAFDHRRHQGLFPTCEGCHRIEGAVVTMPSAEACAECHDGTVERQVEWTPPARTPTNLAFDHTEVLRAIREKEGREIACEECHTPSGAPRMDVRRAVVERCLDCHAEGAAHYVNAPCQECHAPLAEVRGWTATRIAGLPRPADHEPETFALEGHGVEAAANLERCAVCHARESCADCHVNAPSVREIRALPSDPRVAELAAAAEPSYPLPPSHREQEWWRAHARAAGAPGATCAVCHARPSCETCHRSPLPDAVRRLPPPAADTTGRGRGVALERRPPPTHTPTFAQDHRAAASSGGAQCEVCHARSQCTDCHAATGRTASRTPGPLGRYHPENFLQRHSAPAFGAETECAACHNPEAFCRDCHAGQGLRPTGRFDTGFHDRDPRWVFGHGQAARQGLEACAACHNPRDCLVCHSALGGRRVNPHGEGFDADRLRRKNPALCLRCHRPSILEP